MRTGELQARNEALEREIAQRKRAEALLQAKNAELKAFAYSVSHDLKAPLRAISGYAQELAGRHHAQLGERALWCLSQIVTASRDLDRLIEDLLLYSRLDAQAVSASEVDLAHIVQAILDDRKPTISSRHAEVSVSLAVPVVHGWERGLTQALTNLIDNALKYSRDAQPPRVHISSHRQASGVVCMSVADNGIGFDMKYHDRIYGLFNRLVRQEEFEGTGAGLAIVKKVMDRIGGTVWASSEPGAGATFVIELPTAPSAHGEA